MWNHAGLTSLLVHKLDLGRTEILIAQLVSVCLFTACDIISALHVTHSHTVAHDGSMDITMYAHVIANSKRRHGPPSFNRPHISRDVAISDHAT